MNNRSDADSASADSAPSSPRPPAQSLDAVIGLWDAENADMTQHTQQFHRRLAEARRDETIPLSDLASVLKDFRDRLASHFRREEELIEQLQQVRDWAELAASRRQFASDHQHLIQRADRLTEKLGQPKPHFESIGEAVDEVGLFVDAFELHEEQQTQCLQWLTAHPLDFRNLPR